MNERYLDWDILRRKSLLRSVTAAGIHLDPTSWQGQAMTVWWLTTPTPSALARPGPFPYRPSGVQNKTHTERKMYGKNGEQGYNGRISHTKNCILITLLSEKCGSRRSGAEHGQYTQKNKDCLKIIIHSICYFSRVNTCLLSYLWWCNIVCTLLPPNT